MTTSFRGWLRSGGAILICLIILTAAACAGGAGATASPTDTIESAPPTFSPSPTPIPLPPAEMLAAALGPLEAAAEFEMTVSVDGEAVVTSVGRSLGGATQLTVTRGGTVVEYIQIPPNAWAREAGGAWTLVAEAETPGNPLSVLASPATLDRPLAGSPNTLTATYPAAVLGLEGDPVTVEIQIDEASVTFTYETVAAGHPTTSATRIGPTTQLDPIVAPGA